MQAADGAAHLIYPPQCLTCGALVTTDFGLCGACWRDTPFISGLVCDQCGTPLPGEEMTGRQARTLRRLPDHRPALGPRGGRRCCTSDKAARLVLALKHGDRLDLARPGAVAGAGGAPLMRPGMLVAPVPLHWLRLLQRRYNQSALLSRALARLAGLDHCPDLLLRRAPPAPGRPRPRCALCQYGRRDRGPPRDAPGWCEGRHICWSMM
jgi:predicted amidophosphoribosyltransferase